MYDVKPLLLAILDSDDHGPALVLADWLTERGDEFADELRRPKVGPVIVSVFRRWCNEFNFTPTLELLKDAAKMRTKDPIPNTVAAALDSVRRTDEYMERFRQVQEELERIRREGQRTLPSDLDTQPYARPIWEWRPNEPRMGEMIGQLPMLIESKADWTN